MRAANEKRMVVQFCSAGPIRQQKRPRLLQDAARFLVSLTVLTLTGFEPALRLVDYIDAAFTAHDAAIAMTLLERAEGVTYFHVRVLRCRGAAVRRSCSWTRWSGEFVVDDTGIEPVTPSMSTKCSTAELIIHFTQHTPSVP